jgi:putative endopeptidase
MTSIKNQILAALFFSLIGPAGFSANTLSRNDLLKGSEVPEKRSFPLSKKLSPCEDFHAYVCDEVETSFHLPEDRNHWTFSFSDAAERLLYAKKQFFKKLGKSYAPSNPRTQQLANFYKACMNPKAEAKDEKKWVETHKKQILALKTREQLIAYANKNIVTPYFSFLDIGILANQTDPTANDLRVGSHLMSLPEQSYYQNEPLMADFKKLAEKLFSEAGLDHPAERATDVVALEVEFAKIYPLPAEMRQRWSANTYWPKEKWIKTYPDIDLKSLFALAPEKTAVRNLVPEAMQFLEDGLKSRSVDQLRNVILYHELRPLMDDAYPKYYAEAFNFRKKHLGGPHVRPPRDERCTLRTMSVFNMELDQELIPILFPDFPEKEVIQLAENVRSAIARGLKKNAWLSESARTEAIKKITDAHMKLVRPHKEEDWNFLPMKKYSSQNPIGNEYLADKARIEKTIAELQRPRNRERWEMGPLTLNAYYSSEDNQFVLLQGILQYPFFDPQLSMVENTGAIGTVIGHELGHSVDDQGSKYDSEGKLRQWMSMKDLAEFSRRSQGFIDRFNKIGHNGTLTLGENIGDHVGMTFALDAAFPDKDKAAPEDLKAFFVAYARMWCHVEHPDYAKMIIKTNPHALGTARINQQVIHQDAFYKAYQCKPEDKMYVDPKERVHIW